MLKVFCLSLFFSFSFLQLAFSSNDYLHNVCFEIMKEKAQQNLLSKKTRDNSLGLSSILGMFLFPNNYIEVDDKDEFFDRTLMTIIFRMGPALLPSQEENLNEKKKILEQIKPIQDKFKLLFASKNNQECINKAKELNLKEQEIRSFKLLLYRFNQNSEAFNAIVIKKFVRRASENFDNPYVMPATDTKEILRRIQQLSNAEKYNFIFVFHADSTGRLYDYSRYRIEQNFFDKIKLKAKSITIFSCYNDNVKKYYAKTFQRLNDEEIGVHIPVLKRKLAKVQTVPILLFEPYTEKLLIK